MRFFRRKKEQEDKPAEQSKSQEKHQDVTKKPEAKKEKAENNKAVTARYHVSQNKDEKSEHYKEWRIRKEGSDKTIKYFKTQKQAIDYAEDLAQNQGSSIVIHKVDGSLRKQDYSKK